jgi:DNA modification methylase
VIQGNCHQVLNALPDVPFVQTVFIDPPYNIGMNYGSGRKADLLPIDEHLAGIESVVRECSRRLTQTGSLWFLCPEKLADHIGTLLSGLLPRRNRIIWRETFGQYHEHCFPNGHRHLFWHVKDPNRSPFNTDEIRVQSRRMETNDKRAAGPRVPDDVWEIARLVGSARERLGGHPCQLPEELLRRIILASTNPGDLVLDPMAGTGTTLQVAQCLNRRYLGIEQQKKYIDLIRERLKQSFQKTLHDF